MCHCIGCGAHAGAQARASERAAHSAYIERTRMGVVVTVVVVVVVLLTNGRKVQS